MSPLQEAFPDPPVWGRISYPSVYRCAGCALHKSTTSNRIIGILDLSNYKDYFEHVEGAPFSNLHKGGPSSAVCAPLRHQPVSLERGGTVSTLFSTVKAYTLWVLQMGISSMKILVG